MKKLLTKTELCWTADDEALWHSLEVAVKASYPGENEELLDTAMVTQFRLIKQGVRDARLADWAAPFSQPQPAPQVLYAIVFTKTIGWGGTLNPPNVSVHEKLFKSYDTASAYAHFVESEDRFGGLSGEIVKMEVRP